MHYFYRNYTDWYYCYDSMLSGSDAHISNRHCRLFFYRYGITACALLASMMVVAGAASEAWDK